MKLRILAVPLATLLVVQTVHAQQLNFVTCPIVRDTRTVPCFLAEYEGETYYLAVQQDISADQYPPQLLHVHWASGRGVCRVISRSIPI